MALIVVFVDVFKVRIERVVIEVEVGIGVGGALPGIGDGQHIGIEHFRFWTLAAFGIGDGEGPVVAVVAQGADQLFFGDRFEHTGQVGNEPLLAGDGAGRTVHLVLVVVHEQNTVGVGGNQLEIGVFVGDCCIDIKAQVERMHVRIEFLDEAEVGLVRIVGQVFDVQREPGVKPFALGILERGEETNNLPAQRGALVDVQNYAADAGIETLRVWVIACEVRENLGVFPGRLNDPLDLVQLVGVVYRGAVYNRVLAVVAGHCQQRSRWRVDVQPFREQHVDLVHMLLEGGVAGCVVRGIVGRAQTFAGVKRDIGGLAIGLAPGEVLGLGAAWRHRTVAQGFVVVLEGGQKQFRQMLIAQYVKYETSQNQRGNHGRHIEYAAQPLPSLALRVEKYLAVRHGWFSLTRKRKPLRRSKLYCTNRMEADHLSQSKGSFDVGLRAALSVAPALAAGLALRLWMLRSFFQVEVDASIYGGLAKNLLLHGRYAFTGAGGQLNPTLIRLPGYPLFLVFCFRVFGMENYASACWAQIALELAGCLLLADFARRVAPVPLKAGAAHCTLWLAALCPFTAS